MTLHDRVLAHIDQVGGVDACHPWSGPLSRGKPFLSTGRSTISVRRVVWERAYGALPGNRVFMTCSSRTCVNVKHMTSHDEVGRFWKWVDKSGGADACWPWTGSCTHGGYGQFQRADQSKSRCHRFAYELTHHLLLDEADVIMHACDNPPCCNPRHLQRGTHWENMFDMRQKGRHPTIRPLSERASLSGSTGEP